MKNLSTVAIFGLVIALWSSLARADGKTLVIGRVSDDPNKTYAQLKPMVDYVVSNLHDLGFTNSSVVIAKNPKEMVSLLKQRKIDWVQKGVFQALMYEQQAGMQVMLKIGRASCRERVETREGA